MYSISLAEGITYTFHVDAVVIGYNPVDREVGPLTGDVTENFALRADADACSAPGYGYDMMYYQNFEAGDGGYTVSGVTSWEYGMPTSGPGDAHSGDYAWATNLDGDYSNGEDGYLTSPDIDLSGAGGQSILFTWWQWLRSEANYDYASIEASNDGGGTWTRIYGEVSGAIDETWARNETVLDPSYGVSNFRVRFHFRTDSSVVYPGWYVDDIGITPVPPATVAYEEDFEADDGGYTVSGITSWEWGVPTSGPGSAHSGVNVWATNLEGDYDSNEDGYITSPVIDLSGYAGLAPTVSWWQYLNTEANYDYASIEVSNDGGSTWAIVYGEISGSIDLD
jgi:hypothetical protein